MSKVTSQVNALTSGEWSRKALGRTDLAKYASGAKKLENWLINQLGGASFRPGTRYVASTKSDGWARLIPFQYSTDQDYVLEAGDLYFRLYNNDASLVSLTEHPPQLVCHFDGVDEAQVTQDDSLGGHGSATVVGSAKIDDAQQKFGVTSLWLDGNSDYISFPDHADWQLGGGTEAFTIDLWVRPSSDWDNGTDHVIIAQGISGESWTLQTQSSGKLSFRARDGGTNRLSVVTDDALSWTANQWYHIAVIRGWDNLDTTCVICRDGVVVATQTGATGTVKDYTQVLEIGRGISGDASTKYVDGWMDEVRITDKALWTSDFSASLPSAAWSGVTLTEVITTYLEADIPDLHYAQNNDVLYITHPDYAPAKLSRTSPTSFDLTDVSFKRPPLLDTNITSITITPSSSTGATTLTATTDIFDAEHVGSYWRINSSASAGAIVKITGFTSTKIVTGTVQAEPDGSAGAIGGTTAYTNWAEGAFSDYRGWPATCAFHEQRLYYANTAEEPQKFWASFLGAYDSFDTTATTDDYSFRYEVSTEQRNEIKWLSSGPAALKLGTTGGTFSASSGDVSEPISPTNIMVARETNYGVAGLRPKRISSFLYYIQRNLMRLRELSYSFQIDSTISNDMTLLAEHALKDGSGAIDVDHQQSPNDRIWCVRDDGVLAVLTRNPEQEVMGWCRMVAGYDASGDGQFESVCVIPKNNDDDQVWVITKREINGSTKRFIEFFTSEDFTDKWDAVRCDSSVTRDDPKTIIGMTNASPGVFSCTAHGFTTGDQVKLDGVVLADVSGVTSNDIDGIYLLVEGADADKFTLTTLLGVAINPTTATGYGAYVSDGEVRLMTTAVTGLSHLIGETVVAQVDGYIPSTETYVVQAGGVLTLSAKAAVVHCGLPYEGTIQLLKLSDGSPKGTGQTQMRRIYYMSLRLDKTQGLSIGRAEGELDDLVYTLESDSEELFTGDMDKAYQTTWDRGDEIIIRQDKPLPANLLCVIIESEVT